MDGCYYVLLCYFCMLLHHYYSLLHCNNLLSFTYYSSLSHIIAYYCKMLLFLTLVSSCLDRSKGQHTRNNGKPRWWCAGALSQKPTRDESLMCTKERSPQQSWNRCQEAVLARLSVSITQTTAEIIEDMRSHYAMPDFDGDQDPGVESG